MGTWNVRIYALKELRDVVIQYDADVMKLSSTTVANRIIISSYAYNLMEPGQ